MSSKSLSLTNEEPFTQKINKINLTVIREAIQVSTSLVLSSTGTALKNKEMK